MGCVFDLANLRTLQSFLSRVSQPTTSLLECLLCSEIWNTSLTVLSYCELYIGFTQSSLKAKNSRCCSDIFTELKALHLHAPNPAVMSNVQNGYLKATMVVSPT
jgi:hypothetical protein